MRLTRNFTLAEFAVSAQYPLLVKPVPAEFLPSVRALAERLQIIRDAVGPVRILSGYRAPELNKAVGGSRTSQHAVAEAVDFHCGDFGKALAVILSAAMPPLGQVIYYPDQQFIHMALPSKRHASLSVHWHKPPTHRYRKIPLDRVRPFFAGKNVEIPAEVAVAADDEV